MLLDSFLARLDLDGPVRPDLASLRRLHQAWRTRVPYENLDIQLGRPISLEPASLVDKFAVRGRGGFCYEMNGALALLLEAVGFDVTVVEGAVLRSKRGDGQWGNHIALLVDVDDQTWLADAGIGDAFLEPLPLCEGSHRQGALEYRLERLDAATWRMHHHPGGTVASYDFRTEPRQVGEFAPNAKELATSPDSPYVRVLVAQHNRDGVELALRARTVTRAAEAPRTLASREEFLAALAEFRVPLDDFTEVELGQLWERTAAQHEAWLAITRRT
jgi:N-hydroxyarylamine O-acetyltransferase